MWRLLKKIPAKQYLKKSKCRKLDRIVIDFSVVPSALLYPVFIAGIPSCALHKLLSKNKRQKIKDFFYHQVTKSRDTTITPIKINYM